MFCNLIDNIQRCTEVSWKASNTSRGFASGHEERPFLTIISIILWSLERSQEGRGYRTMMKNTENIVFVAKIQADSSVSLWGTRRFCQVIRRGDAPPEGCQRCEKNTTKTIAGMLWPPAFTGGHERGKTHPSQRPTHNSLALPFIVIETWKQTSVISNDLYKTSKMQIKTAFMHLYNLHLKSRTTQRQLWQSKWLKGNTEEKGLNKTDKSENMENKTQRGENT